MNEISAPSRAGSMRLRDCLTLDQALRSGELKKLIEDSLPRHLTPERMLRAFVQATNKTPQLRECDWKQVIGAMLSLSYIGLEPNTPLNHAYLIPVKRAVWNPETRKYDKEIMDLEIVVGYPGFATLLWNTGFVTGIHADVALPNDVFDFQYGTGGFLRHKPTGKDGPEVTPNWAYAHVNFQFGEAKGEAFSVMPWHDVERIRESSQAYMNALAAKLKAEEKGWKLPKTWTMTPWVRFEREMAAKTPFRRLQKYLKKSPEVAYALDLEERQDMAGTLDFSNVIEQGPDGIAEPPEERSAQLAHEQRGPDPMAAFGQRATPVETPRAAAPAQAAPRPSPAPRDDVPAHIMEAPPFEDEGPAQADPPPAAQAAPQPQAQASNPEARAAAAPRDMWDLFDAGGDMLGSFPSAQTWLGAFERELATAREDGTVEAFLEYNAARVEDARAFPAIRDAISVLLIADEEQEAQEDEAIEFTAPRFPDVPTKRSGAVDEKGAEKYLEHAFGLAQDKEQIDIVLAAVPQEWVKHNTLILLARRAAATRCRQLGIELQPEG